jgi:DNA-binding HxlR family transcriptional regulator
MRRRNLADRNCTIARALDAVGQRWLTLIVRDPPPGMTRSFAAMRVA